MSNAEDKQPKDPGKTVEDALRRAAGNDPAESDDAGASDESAPETANDNGQAADSEALEEARAEIEKYRDLALRAEAEMQNVRRRAQQDVEKAHKYGVEKLIGDLLPVVDSLEKAIESASAAEGADTPANKAIVEGIGLCHKMLLDVLARHGATVVDPEGEPFDPNLHQAMSAVEHAEVEPNTVLTVVQKGYQLNERLVRPAMVMVSKAPSS